MTDPEYTWFKEEADKPAGKINSESVNGGSGRDSIKEKPSKIKPS